MKTAEKNTSSTASHQIQMKQQPFFNKEGESSFFSDSKAEVQTKPFFNIPDRNIIGNNLDENDTNSTESVTDNFAISTPSLQTKCAECGVEEKEGEIQRKEESSEKLMEDEPEIQTKPIFESNAVEEGIQTKSAGGLTVGEPNDKYEVEADAMADQVVQKLAEPAQVSEEDENPELQTAPELQSKVEISEGNAEVTTDSKSANDSKVQASAEPVTNIAPITSTISLIQQKCETCEKEEKEQVEEQPELQKKSISVGATDPSDDENPNIQRRQLEMEATEYPVMFKKMPNLQLSSSSGGSESSIREKIVKEAQKMVGKIEARKDDGSGRRVGAEHLLEIFHLAAKDAWPDEVIENVKYGPELPHWCGIFSVYSIKKAGIDLGYWQPGKGVGETLQATDNPQPGDIGYFHEKQHHCIIKAVNGDTIDSIDGNSANFSEVVEKTRPKSAFTGGFMTAFTGSEKYVQKKGESSVSQPSENNSLQDKLSAKAGKGSTLDDNTKSQMESGFGADFSNVNIHTDSQAVEMNKSLGAQAFTYGNDIYFNQGKYNPDSASGKHLLAHELTHTIQQGNSHTTHTKKYPALKRLGQKINHIQKTSQDAEKSISQFYNTGDSNIIQQFNPLDIINSVTDISEYLDLDLPDNPIEALEMLIAAMENKYVKPVLSVIPGYTASLLVLKSTLATIRAIEYIIDNKEKIIAEIMTFIDEKLDSVKEIVREKLEGVLGLLDDRHFSIIWNVHMLPMLEHLKDNWQETVKSALWEQIWPFEGLTSIVDPEPTGLGKNLIAIWEHIKGAGKNLKDLEFSKAIDDIFMMEKEVVALVNRFYGWVAIAIIASETIAGAGGVGAITAGAGTAAGAAAGFGAGLATAGSIGEVLLAVTIAADAQVLLKSILSLNAVDSMLVNEEKMKENNTYYGRIAQSSISIGMMVAMLALAYLGGKIAELLLSKVTKFLPESILEIIEHVKSGMRGEKPGGNSELEPINVRETPPELNGEFNTLRERVNNPDNIRTVGDSELATKYDVEVTVGEHTYRRRIGDGKWCRFSTPVCGLEIDGVNTKVDINKPEGPIIDVPIEIQVGEQLTVPIQGGRKVQVVSIKREVFNGQEFTMYELKIPKDTRRGFETGSTQRVSDVTLKQWIAEGKVIRWTQERTRLMNNRPEYRDGLVDEVWNASKGPDGKVRDPNNPEIELTWDKNKNRWDQWHMGHKKGHEYNKLVDQYVEGKITWDEFISEYNNPNNYHAEDPLSNMGHKNEAP